MTLPAGTAPAAQPSAAEPLAAMPSAAEPPAAQSSAAVSLRARRMLRWYPAQWRARYGEEFTELLIADLGEQPRSWRRGADVARSGLLARLAGAGLTSHPGHPPGPALAARASLATLACALAAFLTVAAAMWAQLAIGWQWAPPAARPFTVAMIVMSAAMLALAVLAVTAAIPVGWTALAAVRRGRAGLLRGPALLIASGTVVLVMGGRHFGNGWPGTGGHWWPHQGLIPGGVAAFGWACTLSVTSYWAHPAALASFPAAELAWMVLSPAAICCLAAGIAQLVRRLDLSARVLRFQAWVATAAGVSMAAFLSGALCWVTEGGPGPQGLFHAGAIDAAGLAVMTIALATGWRAVLLVHRRGLHGPAGPGAAR
jgi:hypothetical protein